MAEKRRENTDEIEASIVEYFYERQVMGHKCGYCGSKDSFMTNGMWAHRLAGQDYQDLIDRGWRRSGKYMYKPVMNRTCCPPFAIRCETLNFKLSRSQKRVANKMRAFLVDGTELPNRAKKDNSVQAKKPSQKPKEEASGEKSEAEKECTEDVSMIEAEGAMNTAAQETSSARKTKTPCPGAGADPNKPRCRKAKELRLEKRKKRLAARGQTEASVEAKESDASQDVETASADKEKEDTSTTATADAEQGPCSKQAKLKQPKVTIEDLLKLPSDPIMAHRLETKMVQCYPPSQEFTSTFIESYALYKKYQMAVHGDKEEDLSERSFRRFLCDTPLISLDGPVGWQNKYGSFHQQYYLDGKLLMVAVMDILPTYLSSVYVYYDPDYRWLELGVYSALREIELVRVLNRSKPEFQYYCMGYYIHNNPKMAYKGSYSPSFLLCPETYQYTPIKIARKRLDVAKCCRLNDAPWEAERVLSFLGGVLILFEKQVIPYMLFRSYYGHIKDRIVVEYASLVGKQVTQRMFLYLILDGQQENEDSDD